MNDRFSVTFSLVFVALGAAIFPATAVDAMTHRAPVTPPSTEVVSRFGDGFAGDAGNVMGDVMGDVMSDIAGDVMGDAGLSPTVMWRSYPRYRPARSR
jgi:hypothetical protein